MKLRTYKVEINLFLDAPEGAIEELKSKYVEIANQYLVGNDADDYPVQAATVDAADEGPAELED